MTYKQISSKVCIGRVFDRFNIDYQGFIPRVPNWIHSAMNEMKVYTSMVAVTKDLEVIDYKCAIPDETKILDAVMYEGWRLPRIDVINESDADIMEETWHPYAKYQLDNNGYIITTFEAGDIRMFIRRLPVTFDTVTNLWFPDIPENEDLLNALDWFILKRLLERGHKVNNYTLNTNNVSMNPELQWEKHRFIATNSLAAFDSDDREQISEMIRTFLYNQYASTDEFVNPYRKLS